MRITRSEFAQKINQSFLNYLTFQANRSIIRLSKGTLFERVKNELYSMYSLCYSRRNEENYYPTDKTYGFACIPVLHKVKQKQEKPASRIRGKSWKYSPPLVGSPFTEHWGGGGRSQSEG